MCFLRGLREERFPAGSVFSSLHSPTDTTAIGRSGDLRAGREEATGGSGRRREVGGASAAGGRAGGGAVGGTYSLTPPPPCPAHQTLGDVDVQAQQPDGARKWSWKSNAKLKAKGKRR